jgi:hypothetical protein
MTDLRVAQWKRRYRLRDDARGDRARLDRLLASAIDASLFDAALERAGFHSNDEICVRSVESFVRLDRSEPDWHLSVALSVVLADAIAARLRAGGPDVARFRSRAHALADMACRATRGDLARTWAWRQLSIWRGGDFPLASDVPLEVIGALMRDAASAPAVLAAVATEGLLPALIIRVPAHRWVELARAVLLCLQADAKSIAALEPSADAQDEIARNVVAEASPLDAWPRAAANRVLERSVILRAILTSDREFDSRSVRALTVLGLAECEPDLAPRAQASVITAAIAPRLIDRAAVRHPPLRSPSAVAPEPNRRAIEQADPRPLRTTAHGGLLFLLHVFDALGLPAGIAEHPTLAARSLRWVLHRLAQLLAPVAETDPAALAFAGLGPDARVPSDREPPPSDAERAALEDLANAICAWLREHGFGPADRDDRALLDLVTRRRADIVADPAWIEAHFRLGDAATDVRRVGLDLDLGWIPWLGVVVRFAYE